MCLGEKQDVKQKMDHSLLINVCKHFFFLDMSSADMIKTQTYQTFMPTCFKVDHSTVQKTSVNKFKIKNLFDHLEQEINFNNKVY